MPELVFVEGVSGVGKSTMARMLEEELRSFGYAVRAYLEFDYTNPIDFYCTAYLTREQYNGLCTSHGLSAEAIRRNTVRAGEAVLVRYFNGDIPLFEEPLLSELAQHEFCYKPQRLIPLEQYFAACEAVWKNWAAALDEAYDFFIFDGSLLHHPLNDMMRNYGVDGEQAIPHVQTLLCALGGTRRRIFYIKTESIRKQLARAFADRRQGAPTEAQVAFWERRYRNDKIVLQAIQEDCQSFDVSAGNWDAVRKEIFVQLTKNYR